MYAQINGVWESQYFQYETKNLSEDIEPAQFLSPGQGDSIEPNVTFTWTNSCNCTYLLNIRDAEGTLLSTSDVTEQDRMIVRALPTGARVTAQLFTFSDGGTYLREADYLVR